MKPVIFDIYSILLQLFDLKTIYDIKNEKSQIDNTILFSPSAASFDSYKNFEDRGKKFNELFKKIYLNK